MGSYSKALILPMRPMAKIFKILKYTSAFCSGLVSSLIEHSETWLEAVDSVQFGHSFMPSLLGQFTASLVLKCRTVLSKHQEKRSKCFPWNPSPISLLLSFFVSHSLISYTQTHTFPLHTHTECFSGHTTGPQRGVCHCLTLYRIGIQLHVLFAWQDILAPMELRRIHCGSFYDRLRAQ